MLEKNMRTKSFVRLLAFFTSIFVVVLLTDSYRRSMETQGFVGCLEEKKGIREHRPRDTIELHDHDQQRMYIVPVFSREQFMNTLASYVDLCRIVIDWEGYLVEPFICGSRLYGIFGLRDTWCGNEDKMYTYKTIYDIDQLTETLLCGGQCRMDSFDTFLQTSHRKIIVLQSVRPWELHVTNLSNADHVIVDCSYQFPHVLERLSIVLNRHTTQRLLPQFEVQGMLCWNKATIVSTNSLMHAMNKLSGNESFSVLFMNYGARDPDYIDSSFRDKIKSHAVTDRRCANKLKAPKMSQKLEGLSNDFIESIGLRDKKFISVNVRIEKLLSSMSNEQMKCCLQTLNSTLYDLKRAAKEPMDILVTTDISPYGTDACKNPDCKGPSTAVLQQLERLGLNPVYYDIKKFSNFNARIVAGLVETEALIQGQHLITVGTGLFQSKVIHDFIASTRTSTNYGRHIYTICRSVMSFSSDISAPEIKKYVTKVESCLT